VRWGDVDLLRGTIRVRQAKTEAGVRIVHILPILRRELSRYRDQVLGTNNQLVFATASGRPLGSSNIRIRMLAKSVRLANAKLESKGRPPLPEGITPHALRRTFASLLFALGEFPPYVMSQIGHTTAALTLAFYAREMNRRDGEHKRLQALVSDTQPQVVSRACSSTTTSVVARITPRYGTPLGIVKAEATLAVV
jgi:integrase